MAGYLWVKDDDYYHIPLGCLHSEKIRNLWGAGRLVSADPIAFASVRVMERAAGTETAGCIPVNRLSNDQAIEG